MEASLKKAMLSNSETASLRGCFQHYTSCQKAVTHLKSRQPRKLLTTSPNEFPETHPIRPFYFVRVPPTSLTPIFKVHYQSPQSLSLISLTPQSLTHKR
jgi:hypothetical protein